MRRFRRYAYLNCNASLHYYGLILGISTCAIFVCGTMSRLKVLSIQDQATLVWHSKCGSELSIAPLDAWVHTLVLEIFSKGNNFVEILFAFLDNETLPNGFTLIYRKNSLLV